MLKFMFTWHNVPCVHSPFAAVAQCKHPTATLKKLWIALQSAMNETIKCAGHNQFKIPHMNKDKLEREGRLPMRLLVDESAKCCLEDEQNTAIHMVRLMD